MRAAPRASPTIPPGSDHSTRSVRRAWPSGVASTRCSCRHDANGPPACSSTKERPATKSRCTAVQSTLTGPTPIRRTTRAPSRSGLSACTTRTSCHGGSSRSSAPGRRCHAYAALAVPGSGLVASKTWDATGHRAFSEREAKRAPVLCQTIVQPVQRLQRRRIKARGCQPSRSAAPSNSRTARRNSSGSGIGLKASSSQTRLKRPSATVLRERLFVITMWKV